MIESLKSDDIINKVGGRFMFTSLVQHRVKELMAGARPLVDRNGMNDIEVAVEEINQSKISGVLPEPNDPALATETESNPLL